MLIASLGFAVPVAVGDAAMPWREAVSRWNNERISYAAGHYPRIALPDGQVRTVRSLLAIHRPMRFGDYVWNERGVGEGRLWIRIDPARQMLSVFRAGHEIGTSVILYGAEGKSTPAGTFPVLARAEEHQSSLYQAEMPYMLRLTHDGVAIHAATVRQGLATHGCIGVPMAFARKLYRATKLGDTVAIMPG